MGIYHLYCSDHISHLICDRLYDSKTYGVGGCQNTNSPLTCVKGACRLVVFFNKSTQATAKLKLAQHSLSQVVNNIGLEVDVLFPSRVL